MIPVTAGGPPPGFAMKVVRPAKAWVTRKGWSWTTPPPAKKSSELPAHWTKVLDELHDIHSGVCAYLSVYTHRSIDSTSVDHFAPKSRSPISLAYNWTNYRLASRPMNTNKDEHLDVLDPFSLPPDLFTLNLMAGRVGINVAVAPIASALHGQARATIRRLKLNAGEYRELRLRYLDEYLQDRRASGPNALQSARGRLLFKSPFIHFEVARQGW